MSHVTQAKLRRGLVKDDRPNKIIDHVGPNPRYRVLNPNKDSIVPFAYVAEGELVNWNTRERRELKRRGLI